MRAQQICYLPSGTTPFGKNSVRAHTHTHLNTCWKQIWLWPPLVARTLVFTTAKCRSLPPPPLLLPHAVHYMSAKCPVSFFSAFFFLLWSCPSAEANDKMFRGEKIYPRNEEKEAPGGHTSDFNSTLVRWRQSGGAHAAADRKTDRRTHTKKTKNAALLLRVPPCTSYSHTMCPRLSTHMEYVFKKKKKNLLSTTWPLKYLFCNLWPKCDLWGGNAATCPLNHQIIVSSTFSPR